MQLTDIRSKVTTLRGCLKFASTPFCRIYTLYHELTKQMRQRFTVQFTKEMPTADTMDEYLTICHHAEMLDRAGAQRLAADRYLEATLAAPSKWAVLRLRSFFHFVGFVTGRNYDVEATQADKDAMIDISNDETEPVPFRACALLGLANLYVAESELEKSVNHLRIAIDMALAATPSERSLIVPKGMDGQQSVGAILNFLHEHLQKTIIIYETNGYIGAEGIPTANGRPDPAIVSRLAVGGGKCDCCDKNRSDVEGGLLTCTRCERAYYCSRTCQRHNWNAGHRYACRKPREMKRGDYILLRNLVKRPDLNSTIGRIVGLAEGGRFEVSIEGRAKTISVAPDKLLHLRPEK